MANETKTCTKCELTLELFCFGVNGSGYRSICKKCRPLSKRENMLKADKILVNDIEKHNIVLKRFINLHGYQPMPERAWWLRDELRYGKNPEDEFQAWLENEMGNPQPSS